jgi:hypothetical protein
VGAPEPVAPVSSGPWGAHTAGPWG